MKWHTHLEKVWQFIKTINFHVWVTLCISSKKYKHTFIQKVIHLFIEVLFIIAAKRKWLRHPLTGERTTVAYKQWCISGSKNRVNNWHMLQQRWTLKRYVKQRKPHATKLQSYELSTLENCIDREHIHYNWAQVGEEDDRPGRKWAVTTHGTGLPSVMMKRFQNYWENIYPTL